MRDVPADFHIHTALSPCASDEMTPEAIVYKAIVSDLEIIAICDHNSAENACAVQQAAKNIADDLFLVLAGIEITTAEEAHVLGLFPEAESALCVSRAIAETLPPSQSISELYGEQRIINADGEVTGKCDKLLSFASGFTLNETSSLVRRHNGILVAAHVDRPSFSVVSQLGFVPTDISFDALEISVSGIKKHKLSDYDQLGIPLISSSDAHYLHNIGEGRTYCSIESLSFDELIKAFKGLECRRCYIA